MLVYQIYKKYLVKISGVGSGSKNAVDRTSVAIQNLIILIFKDFEKD